MAGASLEYRVAFQAIHDVLTAEWDPVGVGDESAARDEYDSYIPVIYRLLKENAADEKIARHLEQIETEWIGVGTNHEKRLYIARRLREVVSDR